MDDVKDIWEGFSKKYFWIFFAEPFLDVLHIFHLAILHGFDGHGIVSISFGLKSWITCATLLYYPTKIISC